MTTIKTNSALDAEIARLRQRLSRAEELARLLRWAKGRASVTRFLDGIVSVGMADDKGCCVGAYYYGRSLLLALRAAKRAEDRRKK